MTINGGTFETDRLINHTAVTATVSISDPTGGVALTVGTANGSSTFDGLIQDGGGGAGNLEKVGTGTFTLTGANTYTGGTIIDGGTLLANNTTRSATGTGAVQVNSGGTLGGTLAPGASAGTFSLGNNLTLESGATLGIEIGGLLRGDEYDALVVNGELTLAGDLDVLLAD